MAGTALGCGRLDFEPASSEDGGPVEGGISDGGPAGDAGDGGVERHTCPSSGNCAFECGAARCDAVCGRDSTCVVGASGTVSLTAECSRGASCLFGAIAATTVRASCANESSCWVDCRGSADCRVTCGGSARCVLACGGAESCEMRCGSPRAQCLVECGGAASCELTPCSSGERTECGGGALACGRSCP